GDCDGRGEGAREYSGLALHAETYPANRKTVAGPCGAIATARPVPESIMRLTTRSLVLLGALLVQAPLAAQQAAKAYTPEAALAHAKELLSATPLIDGHNDTPWEIRE